MAVRRRKNRKKKSSGAAGTVLVLCFVLLLVTGSLAWLVLAPFGPQTETFVELAPGSSTVEMGQQLEAAGIVRSQFAFDLIRWLKRSRLRAGEYRFDHPAPLTEVYVRIARGDVFTVAVTIPEGSNVFDIAARLEQAGFGPRPSFLEAAREQAGLVSDLDPAATSLEGYLFPDTYRLPRKASPVQIFTVMVRRFRTIATQLGLKKDVHAVVTMASLVERETAVDAERPLVASVFSNRLAKKIPLQTDPAVVYGLELDGRWRGTIYKSDLKLDTPYNTYRHAGLPPGPIANPGLKSLRAAMDPAKSDYLYFVAAGLNAQGHSLFASSLDEHNRNVAGYRQAVKKAGGR
ncbi:MAG: endolytic transglycosylase MltG [Terracidiphilus sp.]